MEIQVLYTIDLEMEPCNDPRLFVFAPLCLIPAMTISWMERSYLCLSLLPWTLFCLGVTSTGQLQNFIHCLTSKIVREYDKVYYGRRESRRTEALICTCM
ncbi:hypothetical protein F4810DRAFT_242912 [Camillea tinctor]|nr:hypothetical protein F4810DRAFT_242912 [Camillea tinctor]